MTSQYIEERDGGYFVAGRRVSLDSVVYAYLRGESPEGIAESFPALNLEQVFGSLAYYAAHLGDVDRYLCAAHAEFETLSKRWQREHPELLGRLAEAKRRSLTRQA